MLSCQIEEYPSYRLKVSGSVELLNIIYDFFASQKIVKSPRWTHGRMFLDILKQDVNLVETYERNKVPPHLIMDRGYFTYLILFLYDLKKKYNVKYESKYNYKGEIKLNAKWQEILRDYQKDAVEKIVKLKGGLIQSPTGSGKALPLTAKVLTEDGFREMGSLKVGDKVFSQDGTLCNVVGYYPQGVKPCYRITTADGQVTECCDEHLWSVHNDGWGQDAREYWRAIPLKEIMRKGLRYADGKTSKWVLPLPQSVQYPEKALPVHPYVLGVLISEGCLSNHDCAFSSTDLDVVEKVRTLLGKCFVVSSIAKTHSWYIKDVCKNGRRRNSLRRKLKELGLLVTADKKHIPNIYLQGSVEQRKTLLAGLFDGDGYVRLGKKTKKYFTSSEQLANDVLELCRSLGYKARLRTCDRRGIIKTSGGKSNFIEYMVTILTNEQIFTSKKHTQRSETYVRGNREFKYCDVAIKSIEKVEDKEMACIAVDHPSQLFITDDFIVTHNTELFLSIVDSYVQAFPMWNVLILVPKNAILDEITERLAKYDLSDYLDDSIKDHNVCFTLKPRVRIINPMGFCKSKKFDSPETDKWLKTVGLVVIDEVHHVNANSYKKLLNKCVNLEYSYGLSATVATKRLNEITAFRGFPYEAQQRIGITGPSTVFNFAKDMNRGIEYYQVHGNFGKPDPKDGQNYHKAVDTMTKQPAFLHAVKSIVTMWGNKILYIPIPFIEAGERIYHYLERHGIKSLHWTGGYNCKPEHIQSLEDVKTAIASGEFRVLISTSTSSEGVDISGLTAALLVCGKDSKVIPQVSGRVGRQGIPIVINMYNREHKTMLNQAKQRNTWIRLNYHVEPKKISLPDFT